MFWNSEAHRWRAHAPNGAMNWAVGMIGEKGTTYRVPEPDGIIQSQGIRVTPRSLYYAQLRERMGTRALYSIILPTQKFGTIWTELADWKGSGLFGDAVVTWLDDDVTPVFPESSLSIGGVVRDLNLLANSPTYAWTVREGPGIVNFTDASLLETSVSFGAAGTYTLELLVSTVGATQSSMLTITVQEDTPQTETQAPMEPGIQTQPTAAPSILTTTAAPSTLTTGPSAPFTTDSPVNSQARREAARTTSFAVPICLILLFCSP